jgi:hypothetical protein
MTQRATSTMMIVTGKDDDNDDGNGVTGDKVDDGNDATCNRIRRR